MTGRLTLLLKTLAKRPLRMAVLLMVVMASSGMAVKAQSSEKKIDWLKELTNRVELHGYAQGGYSWQDANGKQVIDEPINQASI